MSLSSSVAWQNDLYIHTKAETQTNLRMDSKKNSFLFRFLSNMLLIANSLGGRCVQTLNHGALFDFSLACFEPQFHLLIFEQTANRPANKKAKKISSQKWKVPCIKFVADVFKHPTRTRRLTIIQLFPTAISYLIFYLKIFFLPALKSWETLLFLCIFQ